MRDGVAHLGSNQQGHPHRPRKPLQALGASAHEVDTQLTDWLDAGRLSRRGRCV